MKKVIVKNNTYTCPNCGQIIYLFSNKCEGEIHICVQTYDDGRNGEDNHSLIHHMRKTDVVHIRYGYRIKDTFELVKESPLTLAAERYKDENNNGR